MPGALTTDVRDIIGKARAAGRDRLIDPEAFSLCQAAGIRTPEWTFVERGTGTGAFDPSRFDAARLAVKIVAPEISHKSDVGGILVVPNELPAVGAAIAGLERRFAPDEPCGCMVVGFVEHSPAPGAELLLSARWNREFGAVITLGFGGVFANFMADNLRQDRAVTFWSPGVSDRSDILRLIDTGLAGRLASRPFRGTAPPAGREDLCEAVERLCRFALDHMPWDLTELEINPLVAGANGLVAVDALVSIATVPPPRPARPVAKLARLLQPRHMAVVGVSRNANPGRIILTNVIAAGFPPDRIFVVKPDCDEMAGCRCVPDLESLPHPVDLCVLSIPAAQIPDALETITKNELAESVIVIPGGIGEVGGTENRAHRIETILDSSRAAGGGGPVVNGGNCLGVRSLPGRYNTLFIPSHKLGFGGVAAPLAIIAQSGALIAARASKLNDLNPRYLVSIGNQLDLTLSDYLNYLEGDPEVSVFACYAEGFRDGDGLEFLKAAKRLTASGRTVLLYRAGRTAAGTKATASHTAAIAGDYRITEAFAREAGVIVVDTLAEFEDITRTASLLQHKEINGMKLGAISNAGYESVAVADNLGVFTLAEFEPGTRHRLGEILKSCALEGIVDTGNAFDVTPIMGDAPFAESVDTILNDAAVDAAIVGCVPLTGALNTLNPDPSHTENVANHESVGHRLGRVITASSKPVVAVVDAGDAYDPLAAVIAGYGIPTFRTADAALKILSLWCANRIRWHNTVPR